MTPQYPIPEEHDEVEEQTSTICQRCLVTVDGVPAGLYIRWTICTGCRYPEVLPQPSWWKRFLNWLKKW